MTRIMHMYNMRAYINVMNYLYDRNNYISRFPNLNLDFFKDNRITYAQGRCVHFIIFTFSINITTCVIL